MGKGDNYRPVDKEKFDANFERVFGKKKLNIWEGPPLKEESDGVQGDTGDRGSDPANGGPPDGVSKESD